MRKIRLVYQTKRNTCGPACLAMLAGSTEEKMVELLGRRFNGGTSPRQMQWALNRLNIMAEDKWQKDGLWQFNSKALLHYAYARVGRRADVYLHYIIWANNKYYDPSWGILNELFHFSTGNCWQKVESYLPIYD